MRLDEESFVQAAKPQILKCRDGDWNHAKRVVRWVKELGIGREDLDLIVVAGYIHDIGWRGVLPTQKLSFDKLLQYEAQANANSEPYIRSFMSDLNFSKDDIGTVLALVRAADKHQSENDIEAIIVDADNLSKLDINHLKEKFLPSEWRKMYELWFEEFPSRIKTSKGRQIYSELLNKLETEISSELS